MKNLVSKTSFSLVFLAEFVYVLLDFFYFSIFCVYACHVFKSGDWPEKYSLICGFYEQLITFFYVQFLSDFCGNGGLTSSGYFHYVLHPESLSYNKRMYYCIKISYLNIKIGFVFAFRIDLTYLVVSARLLKSKPSPKPP